MKKLLIALTSLLVWSTGCTQSSPGVPDNQSINVAPSPPVVSAPPVAEPVAPAQAPKIAPATKKVCKVINGKQQCKIVKIHKKFNGTPVPTKTTK